jgi:hypothetical protein
MQGLKALFLKIQESLSVMYQEKKSDMITAQACLFWVSVITSNSRSLQNMRRLETCFQPSSYIDLKNSQKNPHV